MYRVRLSSGEEAVYRTVEELALGVQSGTITAEAEFFVADVSQWIPITAAPEYQEAVQRAAILTALEDPELEPGPVVPGLPVPVIVDSSAHPVQIYQMFSRSAAELAARKRPRWILPAALGGAVLLVALAVMIILRSRDTPAEVAEKAALSRSRAAQGRSLSPSPGTVQAVRMAPYNLVARLNDSSRDRARAFADSVDRLALANLLNFGLLLQPEDLRERRRTIAGYRALVIRYRTAQRETEAAYRDTALSLTRSGGWSRTDMQEWRLRMLPVERDSDVAATDSLLNALDQLYVLLEAQQGQYELTPTSASFLLPAAGRDYDRIRALVSRLAPTFGPPPDRSPPPLAILLTGIGLNSLPPRHNR